MFKNYILILFLCAVAGRTEAQTPTEKPETIKYIDHQPEYPGGSEGLYRFLSRNMKYPDSAWKNGIGGKVLVKFIIDEKGAVSNVAVDKTSGDASLDEEAVRVVSKMKGWKPGRANDKPVKVYFRIPISFTPNPKGSASEEK